jgi:hypothetical protein
MRLPLNLFVIVSCCLWGCRPGIFGGGAVDEGGGMPAGGGEKSAGIGAKNGSGHPPDKGISSDVTFKIDSRKEVHPISPYIYGMSQPKWNERPKGIAFVRTGGNRQSAANWETNASNAGADWHFQNDDLHGKENTPGKQKQTFIADAHAHNAAALVTVPMLGYVAADKNGGGDVNKTPDYLNVRFYKSVARKGAPFSLMPNQRDKIVYQDEFVNFIEKKFPNARSNPVNEIFYSLDNEPALWSHTHARLRGDATGKAGKKVTYAELMEKTIEYASAIKDVAPNAKIFGPVLYGWQAFVNLQAAPDAGGRDFLEFYLQELKKAESKYGKRLVDVLDIHWYPEAKVPAVGKKVTSGKAYPELVEARIQAPRSLWDLNYVENSWITNRALNGPIYLIPRLKRKIDKYYPGTRIAITEYYYGGGDDISGGIAQADVLGIFGREDLFAAALWKIGFTKHTFIYGAFEIFRNYDGKGGVFGDVSIRAENSDIEKSSVYAALDSKNPRRMTILCINKMQTPLDAGISIANSEAFKNASVYQLTSAGSNPVAAKPFSITGKAPFQYTMPPRSVSLLVLTR